MSIFSALDQSRSFDIVPLLRGSTFAFGMAALAVLIAGRLRLGRLQPAMVIRCGFPAVVMCLLMLVLAGGTILASGSLDPEAFQAATLGLALLGILGVTQHQLGSDLESSMAAANAGVLARLQPQESENRAAA